MGCLKSILIHIETLNDERMQFEQSKRPKDSQYINWEFIENAILTPMKNREISHFGCYTLLIQISEKKLDHMIARIIYMAEIIEIFEKLRSFFEEMINVYNFKPNQTIFDQM